MSSPFLLRLADAPGFEPWYQTISAQRTHLIMKKKHLMAVGMALLLLFCIVGALWTAYWSLRFGLAPRPPLSALQTMLRVLIVALALVLCWRRRDFTERIALVCAIIAAGSSALFGFGVNSTALQVTRLLFHFLAYSLGIVAIVRWFRSTIFGARSSMPVPMHRDELQESRMD